MSDVENFHHEALVARIDELEARLDHERLHPLEWVNRRVRDRLGNVVCSGPFAGVRLPDWGMTGIDLFAPKVIGSYERELHGWVEEAIAAHPPLVLNVGCAEGYYAVGLARRLPEASVLAFDTAALKIEQLAEIATLNDASVEAHARPCTHADLRELLVEGALVVCDCDGCEDVLLDPQAVPVLAQCSLLVETHDLLRPGINQRLVDSFALTHVVRTVSTEPRYVDDFPELGDLPLVSRQLAISEFRGGTMEFLFMVPR